MNVDRTSKKNTPESPLMASAELVLVPVLLVAVAVAVA